MSEVKEGRIEVLISEEKVQERIRELGEQISKDYAGKSIQMICILKGASVFMVDLAKRITVPVYMDFMSVSSYGSGTESSGIVKINKDLDDPIVGKDVLIIEDIIDTGRTLNYLKKFLKNRGASSIKIKGQESGMRTAGDGLLIIGARLLFHFTHIGVVRQ